MLIKTLNHVKYPLPFTNTERNLTNFRKTLYWKKFFLVVYMDN